MIDQDRANDAADQIIRSAKKQRSIFKRAQPVSLRQARFLIICSLVLASAFAFMASAKWIFGYGQAPSIAVVIIIAAAVAVTWQRYRKLRDTAGQESWPAV